MPQNWGQHRDGWDHCCFLEMVLRDGWGNWGQAVSNAACPHCLILTGSNGGCTAEWRLPTGDTHNICPKKAAGGCCGAPGRFPWDGGKSSIERGGQSKKACRKKGKETLGGFREWGETLQRDERREWEATAGEERRERDCCQGGALLGNLRKTFIKIILKMFVCSSLF